MHVCEPQEVNFTGIKPTFSFTSHQVGSTVGNPLISEVVQNLTDRKEFFYGLEVLTHFRGKGCYLDFNEFLPVLPSVLSIVWMREYSECLHNTSMEDLPNMKFVQHLNNNIAVMPHLSLYRMTRQKLDEFLSLNPSNVLVVRGDQHDPEQEFQYAYQVVQYLKKSTKNKISIAVGGYPEGYTSLSTLPQDKAQNIHYLKVKIDAGADFIISQLCYSSKATLEFIRDVRSAGITVPIISSIILHGSYAQYLSLAKITGVILSAEELEKLEKVKEDHDKVRQFFHQLAVRNIQQIINADVGVYGFQFFTLNCFEPVKEVLTELREIGIIKEQELEQKNDDLAVTI